MSSLEWMPDLATALDELVPVDDGSRADWDDVAARASKRRTLPQLRRRPHWSLRLAVVVALIFLLLGCAATVTYLLLRGNGGIALGDTGQTLWIASPNGQQHAVANASCPAWHPGDNRNRLFCSLVEPSWSPNGTQVAFVRGRWTTARHSLAPSYFSLYVASADGTNLRRLARCGFTDCADWTQSKPAWSPDGKWIAFTRTKQTGYQQSLWVIRTNGADLHRLTHCGGCVDFKPEWSPNGHSIVFERQGRTFRPSLYTIRSDGSHLTKIRSNAADPAWSPNGREIAFDETQKGRLIPWDDGIGIVNANGSHLRLLTPGRWKRGKSPKYPAWSPDGRKLLFLRIRGEIADEPFRVEIWTMNPDGSDKQRLYRSGWAHGTQTPPVWSPDGQKIAFSFDSYHPKGTFVINADGTGLKQISPTVSPELSWQPLPNGR
jgi:Tol biopolymer transport system component